MPSVRFTFSCPTDKDWDIINYLDEFASPADRNVAIKAAVRSQMEEVKRGEDLYSSMENFAEVFQGEMSRMFTMLEEMKQNGIPLPQSISYRTTDGESHEVALENIDKLLKG